MENEFFIFVALISGFVYFSGLVSHLTKEKIGLSGALISTLFGILMRLVLKSTLFSNILSPQDFLSSGNFMKELSRVVVSLQVVAVGMYVPKSYMKKEKLSLFIILVPFMALTFVISTFTAIFLLNLDKKTAMMIGACVTPTDPVLAATIMKGKFASKYIPIHVRNLLTVESAANDGLGSVLAALPLMIDVKDWKKPFIKLVFVDLLLSISIGALLGYCGRKLQICCKNKGWIDKESFLGSMLCLSFFVTALTALFKSADILACFVCGLCFSSDEQFVSDIKDSHLLEVIDMLVNHVFFILFGYCTIFDEYNRKYLFYGFVVLFLRRLPLFLIFKRFVPQLKNFREAAFAGYFGPVGVGAMLFGYHGLHMLAETGTKDVDQLIPILHCVTLSSVVVHGVVGFVLTRIIGRSKSIQNDESEYETTSNCLVDEISSDK